MTVCPECGSDNILSGYGEDTTIFVTSDELADTIDISSDTDSVKNCFHLEAGDDYMTSTVISCNPNGSQEIWYIPQYMRDEMSTTLQEALSSYDELYEKYQTNETDETLIQISNYNYDTYEQFYGLYGGSLICSFVNDEITDGRKYYLKEETGTDEPAICGWVTIFDSTNNKYWNLPFVMCSSKQYYSYYWENNDGSESDEVSLSQTATFDGTTYYYNTNSGAMEGEIGNTDGNGKYFGVFDSLDTVANYVYYNYIKKSNPYNMIAEKFDSMLDRYETQSDISDDSKHTAIAHITDPYNYPELMEEYYNVVDFNLLLQSSLMPTINLDETDTTITKEINKIEALDGDTVAIQSSSLDNISDETATSAVKNYIKWHISSNYKITVKMTTHNFSAFTANVTLTPYSSLSDETEQTTTVSFTLSIDTEKYLQNRIKSKLVDEADSNDIYYDIVSLFNLTNDSEFAYVIMFFSYNKLQSLSDACQSCLDVLITQGIDDTNNEDLYNAIYLPYYNKKKIIDNELSLREKECEQIAYYDDYGNLSSGVLWVIETVAEEIRNTLDFKDYVIDYGGSDGEKVWKEFCSYRRDDEYSNSNYISDGLDNSEVFEKAKEFLNVATKELKRAAIVQHSISTTLKNLLVIQKFQPLVSMFEVGNWIRVKIDETVYKLRLVSYEIDFDSLDTASVEFSDVTTNIDTYTDIQTILSQASSIATSYDYVARQAKNGDSGKQILDNWTATGLDATNVKLIGGADNQSQTWDEHGMLFREYVPDLDDWDDRQLKIINSTIAITDDKWEHIKTAIGRFLYVDPSDGVTYEAYGVNAETIIGKLIIGESLGIYNSDASISLNNDGITINNYAGETVFSAKPDGSLSIGSGLISQDSVDGLKTTYLTASSEDITTMKNDLASVQKSVTSLTANNYAEIRGIAEELDSNLSIPTLKFETITIGNTKVVKTTYNSGATNASDVVSETLYAGDTIVTDVGSQGNYVAVDANGCLVASNAIIFGEIHASAGAIGGWSIEDEYIYDNTNDTNKCGLNKYGNGAAFWAGGSDLTGNNAAFHVFHDGSLYATSATITGTISGSTISGSTISGSKFALVNSATEQGRIVAESGGDEFAVGYNKYGDAGEGYTIGSKNHGWYLGNFGKMNHFYLCPEFYMEYNGDNTWGNIAGFNFNSSYGEYEGYKYGSIYSESSTGYYSGVNDMYAPYVFYASSYGDSSGGAGSFKVSASGRLYCSNSIYSNAYESTSDKKIKEHIAYIEEIDGIDEFFMNLKPVSFKWKENGHRTHIGFYAQDVREDALATIGDLAMFKASVNNDEPDGGYYSEDVSDEELSWTLTYDELIPINIAITQEHEKRIEALEKEIEELKTAS